MKPILFLSLFTIFFTGKIFSQCAVGEVALTMNIQVDAWGQETYWELVPTGSGCGNATIASGSSDNVGCAGIDPIDDTGYPDNTVQSVGPFCLVIGESYDLIFVDSYGDGGLVFELLEDGSFSHAYVGGGDGNTWTFEAGNSGLPAFDSPCGAAEILPDGPAVEMNNTTAVAQLGEPHPDGGYCGIYGYWCEENLTNTLWAYFVAEEGYEYDITTCNEGGNFDTQLALYHANNCADFSTFELISSNDDMAGGCSVADGYSSRMYASCLIPGDTYYIQLDGWNGAIGTAYLSISSYEGTVQFQTLVNDVACPVDKGEIATGSIIPYFIGTGSDFTCTWTGPDNFESNENSIFNLGPGTYDVTATTVCGDIFQQDFEIFQPTQWSVALDGTGPDCEASGNGEILVTVSGATAPYEYAWIGPDNYSNDTEDISDLNFGDYQLTITDDNGCERTQEYALMPLDNFTFNLGNDTIICVYGDMIVYGPPGLTYLWQDGSQNQFLEVDGETWGLGSHAVILTATTDDGCSYSDALIFNVDACSGVEEGQNNLISFYPNPATDFVMIELPGMRNHTEVRITDASGRLVKNIQQNNVKYFKVDIDLPAGVYLTTITSDHNVWTRQFVVGE